METIDVKTIGRRSVHGVLVLIFRTFFLNIISFVASLVIFTILTPAQVGLYTAVVAIQRIISFFTDFGLGAALVQKKDELTKEDLSTSFTLQSLVTLLLFILFFVFNDYIKTFFKLSEQADRLLIVLVFTIFLSSFKTIPSILLERKIRFEKLIIPQIIESIIFNVLLIFLVLRGFGLDSFTWAFLVSALAGIPFYFFVSPWKVTIGIDKKSLSYLKYGLQFQAKNILAVIKDDFLTVILAKVLTFTELGYIGFAQKLAFFAFRYIVDSLTKVSFSTYSRIQQDLGLLKKAIEKSIFFASSIMFPVLLAIIITVPYVILYFPKWHNKWEPAIVSIVFFCLNGIFSSISNVLVSVLDSTGRVKTTLNLMIGWVVLTWILTPLALKFYGYNGVAIASFLVSLTLFFTIYLAKKIVNFAFIRSIFVPLVSSIGMGIFVYFSAATFAKDFLTLLVIITLGGGIYMLSLYILAKKEIKEDIRLILHK